MQKDSLNIEAQFVGLDTRTYIMLEDGSCYRIYSYSIEPITRSFYGHNLKQTRKRVLNLMAECYRLRGLARKSRDYVMVDRYTKEIKGFKPTVDKYDRLWSQFRKRIVDGRNQRRDERLRRRGNL